ncbi:hypothetical protein Fot_03981 [Forsythia ovata]|uniref:Uncharacterized protein n=1 Tax=Forsythia ovata TaxID=205694 RepID=A0ABD1XB94_9LAMI
MARDLSSWLHAVEDDDVEALSLIYSTEFHQKRKGKAKESSFLKNVEACDMPNSRRPIGSGDEIYTITRPKPIKNNHRRMNTLVSIAGSRKGRQHVHRPSNSKEIQT